MECSDLVRRAMFVVPVRLRSGKRDLDAGQQTRLNLVPILHRSIGRPIRRASLGNSLLAQPFRRAHEAVRQVLQGVF